MLMQINERDQLYYDQYEYCVSFKQDKASCYRDLDPEKLRKVLASRMHWEAERKGSQPLATSEYSDQVQERLNVSCKFLAQEKAAAPLKIIISSNYVCLYTNDKQLMDRIETALPFVQYINIKQAVITRAKGVILLNTPKHSFRVFLRDRPISNDQKQVMLQWINSQPIDQVRACGSLRTFLGNKSSWYWSNVCQRHYHLDVADSKYATWIGLIVPGFIRNIATIQKKQ
jgi:hypothetical protein